MKRIKSYLLLFVTSLMVSCNALDLGAEDIYSLNNYWKSPEQCDRFVRGLHFRLRSRSETYFQMGEVRCGLFNLASLNSTGESSSNIDAKKNVLTAANPGLTNWGAFYTDIYQVNHAIDKISNECAFLSDDVRNKYLGQLYGMRAFYYFHLLRTWGGVPLCDKPDVLITDDMSKLNKPRSSEQEIWQFIRDDVNRSCECFDNTTATITNIFWNKGASYCLKADVYLWGAKVKPLKGTSVFSSTPEQDLRDAKTALLAVEPLYKYNAKFVDAFSATNKESNKETVFAFHNQDGETSTIFSNFTYNSLAIAKFLDKDGKGLNNPLNLGGGAQRHEYLLSFYNGFSEKDTRKAATFYPYYSRGNDDKIELTGVCFKKILGTVNKDKIQLLDCDMPVYRYMDIALMLAEINNELSEPADVKKWIEVVRTRAYGASDMPVFTYTNKEAAEEAILRERQAEFVGEFKAWYDLRRMMGGKYALELVDDNALKLVWPIDAKVLSSDSLVEQNEGYL